MKTRREMLEEFVGQDPSDSFSRYALALELEKEGREEQAILELREVLIRDRSYVPAYYHLGRLLVKQQQTTEARDVFSRGIEVAGAAGDQKTRAEIQDALNALE